MFIESVIEGTLKDAVAKISDGLSRLTNTQLSDDPVAKDTKNIPLVQHVTAGIAAEGASIMSHSGSSLNLNPSPAGRLMHAYSQMQLKLGDARLEYTEKVKIRFMEPFSAYRVAYDTVLKKKKKATKMRVEVDQHRRHMPSGGAPEAITAHQTRQQQLEHEFLQACDGAIEEMNTFIQYVTNYANMPPSPTCSFIYVLLLCRPSRRAPSKP